MSHPEATAPDAGAQQPPPAYPLLDPPPGHAIDDKVVAHQIRPGHWIACRAGSTPAHPDTLTVSPITEWWPVRAASAASDEPWVAHVGHSVPIHGMRWLPRDQAVILARPIPADVTEPADAPAELTCEHHVSLDDECPTCLVETYGPADLDAVRDAVREAHDIYGVGTTTHVTAMSKLSALVDRLAVEVAALRAELEQARTAQPYGPLPEGKPQTGREVAAALADVAARVAPLDLPGVDIYLTLLPEPGRTDVVDTLADALNLPRVSEHDDIYARCLASRTGWDRGLGILTAQANRGRPAQPVQVDAAIADAIRIQELDDADQLAAQVGQPESGAA